MIIMYNMPALHEMNFIFACNEKRKKKNPYFHATIAVYTTHVHDKRWWYDKWALRLIYVMQSE